MSDDTSCSRCGEEHSYKVRHVCQPRPDKPSGGLKYDGAKPMVSLLSSKWVLGVADVLTFGAKKYAAHNWRQGISASRLLSAAQRHILAFQDGEDVDPESGLPHLAHASCCLMFLFENQMLRPETDDRWKAPTNVVQPEQQTTTEGPAKLGAAGIQADAASFRDRNSSDHPARPR